MRTLTIVGLLAIAGLAVCLLLEWQAVLRLTSENETLRRQLDALPALRADNLQLSNRVAHASASPTESQAAELARLRQEVEELHGQTNEIAALRADTRTTRETLKATRQALIASRAQTAAQQAATNDIPFQILEAHYGTDRTNADVSAELVDRIRGNRLKMIAYLKSVDDPAPGQTKFLTVVYESGGVVMTNQFRGGEVVILPPDPQ